MRHRMGFIEQDGHYYDRCGDCGGAIKERIKSKRDNICDDCWERREWLVKNILNRTDLLPEFKRIQIAMANHTGTAKRRIVALQKLELAKKVTNG